MAPIKPLLGPNFSLRTPLSNTLSRSSSLNVTDHVSHPHNTTSKFMFPSILIFLFSVSNLKESRSQWPRGLRRRSSAARLLRLWVRISPGVWMFVRCECCVLSGRGLCDRLITRPEESYQPWCVVVCEQETSKTRKLKPATGLWKYKQKCCYARKTNNKQPCVDIEYKSIKDTKKAGGISKG